MELSSINFLSKQMLKTGLSAWNNLDIKMARVVEQHVIKKLLQALIFEEIISFHFERNVFNIKVSNDKEEICYIAEGSFCYSYNLIKLSPSKDVIRKDGDGNITLAKLDGIINEILRKIPNATKIENFINELNRTYVHEIQSKICHSNYMLTANEYLYDILESYLINGHPYHPCYKSRVGFSLFDNIYYGFEFAQPVNLVWLAIHKSIVAERYSYDIDKETFILNQISSDDIVKFQSVIKEKNVDNNEYIWIPVHPWQWENCLVYIFYEQIVCNNIIYLGHCSYRYIAQQSIRTLTNIQYPHKPYIKLSMDIVNTSSSRKLEKHTVMNGPIITDWIQKLIEEDDFSKELDFVILKEICGLAVDISSLPGNNSKYYNGMIGCIWRESVHKYLYKDEDAIPLNGVSYIQQDGTPLIQSWIHLYGIKEWIDRLLNVVVLPIIHLLFSEGIGTESHSQNIILVHKNGLPTRIILKDFHDGIKYCPSYLTHPELAPDIEQSSCDINSISSILTDDLKIIRDFSCACLFFVALSDIAIFFHQIYKFPEKDFWKTVADIIKNYQSRFPEHAERFKKFDLFSENLRIEALTKRRIFGDKNIQIKVVKNPLFIFK